MNGYKTISENIEFEIAPIKKSRFIACIYKVANHIEVLNSLNAIKNSYPGANHYCWAYSLLDNNQYRFNDDGEPSGSAGKPILSHIQGFEVTNVLVGVVRYFGGTRLGVGGLIRAYGQAAKEGLALAKIIHVEHQIQISIEYDYSETAIVDTLIKCYDIKVVKEDYSDSIFRILKIDTLNRDIFLKEIKNMTKGKIKITVH